MSLPVATNAQGSSLDFRIAATTDIHAKAAGDFKESRGGPKLSSP